MTFNLNGQTDYSINTYQLSFLNKNEVLKYSDIIGDDNLFIGYYKLGGVIHLECFSKEQKLASTIIELPKKDKRLISDHSIKLSKSNDTLILSIKNLFYLFKLNKNYSTEIISRSELKNNYGINHFYKNGTFYSYDVKNTMVELEKSFIIEKKSFSSDEKQVQLTFDYPVLSVLGPNNFISFSPTEYFVAQATKYKIYIYNYSHQKTDSILLSDTGIFKTFNDTLISKIKEISLDAYNVVDYFPFLQNLRNLGSHIWSVNVINENVVMIRFSSPLDSTRFNIIDHIWKKTKGKWELILKRKLSTYFNELDKPMEEKDIWPYYVYGSKIKFSKNKIHFFYWSNSDINIKDKPTVKKYFSGNVPTDKLVMKLSVLDFKP